MQVQGSWIVAFQPPQRSTIIRCDDALSLPSAQEVRERLAEARIDAVSCVLITPRDQWVLDINRQSFVSRREMRLGISLIRESLLEGIQEPAYVAQALARVADSHELRVYTAAIRQACVEEYLKWLEKCGLELMEMRVSSFETTRSNLSRGTEIMLAGYPDGSWEVSWVVGGALETTYVSGGSNPAELCKTLVLMSLRHLIPENVELWQELPDSLYVEAALKVTLTSSGYLAPEFLKGCTSWRDAMTSLGVDLTIEEKKVPEIILGKGEIRWPRFALQGAYKRSRSCPMLVVGLNKEQKHWADRLLLLATGLLIVLTVGLAGLSEWMGRRYAVLLQELNVLDASYDEVLDERLRLDELEDTLEYGWTVLDREAILEVLSYLDGILPSDSKVEQLFIEGDAIELTIAAESAIESISALQSAKRFENVTLRTSITAQERVDGYIERVGISLQVTPDLRDL